MRNAFFAIAASVIFISGCGHSTSAVPHPIGVPQSNKNSARLLHAQPQMQFADVFSFHGPDGKNPTGSLIQDASGNLYGTALGTGAARRGVVFKLDPQRNESVLYQFKPGLSTGRQPTAGVIQDGSGNFYGTTEVGGTHDLGVVYELDSGGTETVLHSFNGADGANPFGTLIRDRSGNLYGTTYAGGSANMGVVFKISATRHETVLHSFTGSDGANPVGGVIRTAAGNLFGTTGNGGTGGGVIFEIDSRGNESVLYVFRSFSIGVSPGTGLVRDSAGNFYGTTLLGGPSDDGVVFKYHAGDQNITVLHSFSGADGMTPLGALILDSSGNIYGTTGGGGASEDGVVFELDPTGNETVLHSFNYSDGWQPLGSLTRDSAGDLYGTTRFGGASGYGVIFELTP
jgi:uncharacterized repeat protein (TIGR03803 family)